MGKGQIMSKQTFNSSLAETLESLETLSRGNRQGKSVTMSEVTTIDNLATSSQSSIASSAYIALGGHIIDSNFTIDKKAMKHEVQLPTGKVSDKGIAKRNGVIQAKMLRIKNGCHHLRNAGYLAKLLPCGETVTISNKIGSGVNKFFSLIGKQTLMANPENVSQFLNKIVEYLDNNKSITDDTILQTFEMGLRHYDKSKGLSGVKVTRITYKAWREKALNEADKRQKMALNATIIEDTKKKRTEERKAEKVKAETKANLLAKHFARLVEMAENQAITAETVQSELLKHKDLVAKAS